MASSCSTETQHTAINPQRKVRPVDDTLLKAWRILDNLLDSRSYDHKAKLLSVEASVLGTLRGGARESVKSALGCIPGRRSHAVQMWRDEMAHAVRAGQCPSLG